LYQKLMKNPGSGTSLQQKFQANMKVFENIANRINIYGYSIFLGDECTQSWTGLGMCNKRGRVKGAPAGKDQWGKYQFSDLFAQVGLHGAGAGLPDWVFGRNAQIRGVFATQWMDGIKTGKIFPDAKGFFLHVHRGFYLPPLNGKSDEAASDANVKQAKEKVEKCDLNFCRCELHQGTKNQCDEKQSKQTKVKFTWIEAKQKSAFKKDQLVNIKKGSKNHKVLGFNKPQKDDLVYFKLNDAWSIGKLEKIEINDKKKPLTYSFTIGYEMQFLRIKGEKDSAKKSTSEPQHVRFIENMTPELKLSLEKYCDNKRTQTPLRCLVEKCQPHDLECVAVP